MKRRQLCCIKSISSAQATAQRRFIFSCRLERTRSSSAYRDLSQCIGQCIAFGFSNSILRPMRSPSSRWLACGLVGITERFCCSRLRWGHSAPAWVSGVAVLAADRRVASREGVPLNPIRPHELLRLAQSGQA